MRITVKETNNQHLSALMDEFFIFKKNKEVCERTLKDYRVSFDNFLVIHGNSIEYNDLLKGVSKFFSQIPNTSSAIYNRPYSNINSLFIWMVRKEYIPRNPIKDLELTKRKDEETIHSATIDDIRLLLKVCDKKSFTGLRNYVITLLMLDTGIRTSELCRLEKCDYNRNDKSIVITSKKAKTKRQRILYLSPSTATALNKYLRNVPEEVSYMFPSRDCGMMTTNNLDKEFRKLCDKAGVKLTPYQLRHSFATYFVQNGGNLFVLQQLMGHSDLRITKRYTDISEEQKKVAHSSFSPALLLEKKNRLTIK